MTPIDDLLAPGRALESLMRRAARGNRAAWALLVWMSWMVSRAYFLPDMRAFRKTTTKTLKNCCKI